MNTYRAGIDIGSTTVKLVLLDEEGKLLFGEYRRHCAHTQEALSALLREAREQVGDCALRAKITGSGAINLAKALGIPFVQEVVAVADALRREAPQTDVAIELGGEDAKSPVGGEGPAGAGGAGRRTGGHHGYKPGYGRRGHRHVHRPAPQAL